MIVDNGWQLWYWLTIVDNEVTMVDNGWHRLIELKCSWASVQMEWGSQHWCPPEWDASRKSHATSTDPTCQWHKRHVNMHITTEDFGDSANHSPEWNAQTGHGSSIVGSMGRKRVDRCLYQVSCGHVQRQILNKYIKIMVVRSLDISMALGGGSICHWWTTPYEGHTPTAMDTKGKKTTC